MVAYQQQKIENTICYLAQEHVKRARKPAYQTYVYKYLALFDFRVLERTGKPALDWEYEAYERGPVPKRLYDSRHGHSTNCYDLKPEGENSIIVVAKKRPDMRYFSIQEMEVLNEILEEWAHPWVTTDDLNEASHSILAWQKAWQRRGTMSKAPMSYDDNFEGLQEKTADQLSPEEETYLTFRALKNAS